MYAIRRISVPGIFQGKNRKTRYFEGWYFKVTDSRYACTLAFIPGVSYGNGADDRHAFIQVLDAFHGRSEYFRFDFSEFQYDERDFEISVGNNRFTSEGFRVSLENDHSRYFGELLFSNIKPFPHGIFSPGIMGPFRWTPFMECYHDTINIRHSLTGSIETVDARIDFTGGTGYLEKDWGTSFPESWIWLQCNHFDKPGTSFMLSYARIPFLGTSFKGFIAFLATESSLIKMGTYNGYKVTSLDTARNKIDLIAENRKYALNVHAELEPGCTLKAPRNGLMEQDITESLSSAVEVTVFKKKGRILFQGKGKIAGVELGGDTGELAR